MNAGRLNRRVEIQEQTATRAVDGASVASWATIKTVWCSITPTSSSESTARGNAVEGTASHVVKMRFKAYPSLTMRHRFKYGTRIFRIQNLDNVTGWAEEWRCAVLEQA